MTKGLYMTAMIIAVFISDEVYITAASQNQDNDAKTELLRLEGEWNDAYNHRNEAALGRILSDDYQFIDADSYVLTKRQYLDTMSRIQVKSETLKYPSIRLYGNTAIVFSIWSGIYSYDGKETTDTIRYTDVFIKENGKWLAVASQGTRIPKH